MTRLANLFFRLYYDDVLLVIVRKALWYSMCGLPRGYDDISFGSRTDGWAGRLCYCPAWSHVSKSGHRVPLNLHSNHERSTNDADKFAKEELHVRIFISILAGREAESSASHRDWSRRRVLRENSVR